MIQMTNKLFSLYMSYVMFIYYVYILYIIHFIVVYDTLTHTHVYITAKCKLEDTLIQ